MRLWMEHVLPLSKLQLILTATPHAPHPHPGIDLPDGAKRLQPWCFRPWCWVWVVRTNPPLLTARQKVPSMKAEVSSSPDASGLALMLLTFHHFVWLHTSQNEHFRLRPAPCRTDLDALGPHRLYSGMHTTWSCKSASRE